MDDFVGPPRGKDGSVRDTRTAVVGAGGFIGRRLWQSYRRTFPDCVGTARSPQHPDLLTLDLTHPSLDATSLRLRESGHEAVVIAAACADVGYCERHPEASHAVNVRGTLKLIEQLGRTGLQIIFISSDYVFDGVAGDYDDDTPTAPTTKYGRQKERVEKALPTLADDWLLLRFSKVYDVEKNDASLLDEMARRLAQGQEVSAATDQFFTPTHVNDIIDVMRVLQSGRHSGAVNLCSSETFSRYAIARQLATAMNVPETRVKPVSLHDLPSMRGRPKNTAMRSSRLRALGMEFRPLRAAIEQVAANWRA